jgi:3-hydroxybutyrate dehydrogenase
MRLERKTAFVTGAASGIGREIAKTFLAAGAKVAIADINVDGARAVANALDPEGRHTLPIRMDVTNEQEVERSVDATAERFGSIDILVSNAGIQIVHPIEEFPFNEWKRLLAIHLDGAFLTTKACVRYMYRQQSGTLIYMGSVHSHEASPLKTAYVAAKHGILGLARVMAKEGARHNVRSAVICPGFVKTPLVEKQIPELAKSLGMSESDVVRNVMLGETVDSKFTTMDDVAQLALFLASSPSNALTGQSVVISHGWHMN